MIYVVFQKVKTNLYDLCNRTELYKTNGNKKS